MALEAGGLSTAGHPVSACEYDSFYLNLNSIRWTSKIILLEWEILLSWKP